jgi:hypothetical protein
LAVDEYVATGSTVMRGAILVHDFDVSVVRDGFTAAKDYAEWCNRQHQLFDVE